MDHVKPLTKPSTQHLLINKFFDKVYDLYDIKKFSFYFILFFFILKTKVQNSINTKSINLGNKGKAHRTPIY